MKLYGAEFDATYISIFARDKHDAMSVLLEDAKHLGLDIYMKTLPSKENALYIKWTDTETEDIHIEEIKTIRGILSVESH